MAHFNPRSLTGATVRNMSMKSTTSYFNPRSLTGATTKHINKINNFLFQSTLPHGSDISLVVSVLDAV